MNGAAPPASGAAVAAGDAVAAGAAASSAGSSPPPQPASTNAVRRSASRRIERGTLTRPRGTRRRRAATTERGAGSEPGHHRTLRYGVVTPVPTIAPPPTGSPSPGRPRDPRRDAAIRDAALALLADVGYERMTVDAIAAAAGVSKPTIYRRWAGKHELVADAIRC